MKADKKTVLEEIKRYVIITIAIFVMDLAGRHSLSPIT